MSKSDRRDAPAVYAGLLERATSDPSVVGVVVFGSRAAGPYAEPTSDVDCFVVVDGSADEAEAWQTAHGSPVEAWAMTLDEFRAHALPGSSTVWNRPAFLRARVDLDKLDGEIARIVDRKRTLDAEEASALVANALDGAINSLYRALRNLEGGRDLAGRLDALEAIGPFLASIFGLERRVRPFNKWLAYELDDEPLIDPAFAGLTDWLGDFAGDPTAVGVRDAFRRLEASARAGGHGRVVDGWEPDVPWLRGEGPYRPR